MSTAIPKPSYSNQHIQQFQQQYVPRKPSPLARFSSIDNESDINNNEENVDNNHCKINNMSSDINNENKNVQIKTVYPILHKSYSISNNNLLSGNENTNEIDIETKNSTTLSSITNTFLNKSQNNNLNNNLNNNETHYDSRSTSISNTSNISTLNGIISSSINSYNEKDIKISNKIPLFVHGDHVLIFNIEYMKELTIKYGITGQLSGTLPLAPQQNSLLGFPWRLNLYEVLWCLNEGICILIDSEDIIKRGYIEDFINNDEKRDIIIKDLKNRLNIWRDEKQKEIEEQMKKLNIIRKPKKGMKALDNGLISSASMPDLQQALNDNEKKNKELEEAKKSEREMKEKSKKNKIVFMETPSDDSRFLYLWRDSIDKYLKKDEKNDNDNYENLNLLRRMIENEANKMDYINRETCYEKIWMNFMMFKYLKSNLGYSLLPGMRFGGLFVSYPGDPLRYHAQQIIETKEYYKEDIGLFRICNRGRLATGVRKVWVVGGCVENYDGNQDIVSSLINHNNNDDNMRCFSIEWAGF